MSFYYPEQDSLQTSSGPLVIGSGLTIDYETGTLLATPGGLPSGVNAILAGAGIHVSNNTGIVSVTNTGALDIQPGSNISVSRVGGVFTVSAIIPPQLNGTVTRVNTGTGLTGGPITSSGTISLEPTGVSEGTYYRATIAVDSYGRVLSASDGQVAQNFDACPPISVSGSDPVVIDICSATPTSRGVVALCNSLTSSSQLSAATPCAVACVYTVANIARNTAFNAYSCSTTACLCANAALTCSNAAFTQADNALTQVVAAQNTADTALADALNAQNTANNAEAISQSAEITANTALTTAATALPLACFTQKGTIVVGNTAGIASGVTPTSDGQILISCSICSTGVHWVDPSGSVGTVTQVNAGSGLGGGPITSVGALCILDTGVVPGNYANACLTINSRGQITSATSASQTAGIPCGIITRCGDLIVGQSPNQPVAFGPGNRGQVLTANPDCALMMQWATPGLYVPDWIYAGRARDYIQSTTQDTDWGNSVQNDYVYYRQLGPKTWEVNYGISRTCGNENLNGEGSYYFTLPNNLCLDTSLPFQQVSTAPSNNGSYWWTTCSMPASVYLRSGNESSFTQSVYVTDWGGVVPYGDTTIRVMHNGCFLLSAGGYYGWPSNRDNVSWCVVFSFQST